MPYRQIEDLPASVKGHLPVHAQEIYLKAFNAAWDEYRDPGERRAHESREATAHKVAWAAVKTTYVKDEMSGQWRVKAHRQ
ncbi:Putative cation transport regulator ChaB [Pandoraea eparura]|uniref:Cation transport regulator ChaB n=1 Tax=Pandoraea eparura TaxID=2508291 RepID=A0A5E4XUX8_9BURK|nr:ChaB family protein [Pandoraea eparura]VVE40261.1 Putative cation transport regulator ChaB [Pandoraea eparura]